MSHLKWVKIRYMDLWISTKYKSVVEIFCYNLFEQNSWSCYPFLFFKIKLPIQRGKWQLLDKYPTIFHKLHKVRNTTFISNSTGRIIVLWMWINTIIDHWNDQAWVISLEHWSKDVMRLEEHFLASPILSVTSQLTCWITLSKSLHSCMLLLILHLCSLKRWRWNFFREMHIRKNWPWKCEWFQSISAITESFLFKFLCL